MQVAIEGEKQTHMTIYHLIGLPTSILLRERLIEWVIIATSLEVRDLHDIIKIWLQEWVFNHTLNLSVMRGVNKYSVPSRFSHQSSDCAPLNPGQLSCFKVGEWLFETQTELVVTLKERSERQGDNETIEFQKQKHSSATYSGRISSL